MRNTLIKVQNRDGSRFQAEALQHEAGTHIRAIQALLGHCSSRLIWKAPLGSQTLALAGEGLLKPLRLISGEVMQQYLWNYRVVEDSGLWVLQSLHDEVWQDLYMFTFEPQFLVDFEMANHYVSTFPTSRFVQTLTVQLSTPEARYLLRDHEYTVARGELTDSHMIKDADLLKVLSEIFGLEFPIGTQFQSQAQRLETLLGAA